MIGLNHMAENYVFFYILFIVLWCLFFVMVFFVGCLVGQTRMCTRGFWVVFYDDYLIGCHYVLYDLNQDLCLFALDLWWALWFKLKFAFMRFTLWSICVYLGLRTNYTFGLPVKEPNLIIIGLLYETQLWSMSFRRGCLGACLWEWLEVVVQDPKWLVLG